jgi:hypothetical protein
MLNELYLLKIVGESLTSMSRMLQHPRFPEKWNRKSLLRRLGRLVSVVDNYWRG